MNEEELKSFEAELREYSPRAAEPLPHFIGVAPKKMIWSAVAAVFLLCALLVTRLHRRSDPVLAAQTLTQVRAQAALARGDTLDQIAPLVTSADRKPVTTSALDVLSEE